MGNEKTAEKTETEIIREDLIKFSGGIFDRDMENLFENPDEFENEQKRAVRLERIEECIVKKAEESPRLRDYIYRVIFVKKNMVGKYKNYDEVTTNQYNKIMEEAFKDNGLELNEKEMQKIKSELDKKASRANREVLFQIAFGLNLECEEVSLLLKKALLQQDFNAKNYKEVIYYWCFANGSGELGKHKIDTANKLIEMYEKDDFTELDKKSYIKEDTETRMLLNCVLEFNDETEFKKYLTDLRRAQLDSSKRNRVNLVNLYEGLLTDIPRIDTYKKEYVTKEGKVRKYSDEDFDRMYEDRPGAEKTEEDMREFRRIALKEFRKENDGTEKLLDKDIAKDILGNLCLSDHTIRNRITINKTAIERNEMLILEFMIFVVGEELDNPVDFYNKERHILMTDFITCATDELEGRGMYGIYERNPLDLFLIFCILHKNPFNYFMANWALALDEDLEIN